MKKKFEQFETVDIDKLVHGGQGMGVLADGKKAFIWNALPREKVFARITKSKKDYVEGIAEEIIHSSKNRISPMESIYLATSPWQIMTLNAENNFKKDIIVETFRRENIDISWIKMISNNEDFNYRNKLEFSFYGDNEGLHYAFYNRGTHQKQIVEKSLLAKPAINNAAKNLLGALNELELRAADLKSVILRCTQDGKTVAALFVKCTEFPKIKLPEGLSGLKIYHSNPRSPASVATKLLQTIGDNELSDTLIGTVITYDVIGFFQVNIPVFQLALKQIDKHMAGEKNKIDLYSGVGSIGIPINGTTALIELDPANVAMARKNIGNKRIKVIQESTEKSLQYITSDTSLIIDPPRSGVHKDVICRILKVQPKLICYLSCNPSTQARDVAALKDSYTITFTEGYNFFPRTPHIESLVILERK